MIKRNFIPIKSLLLFFAATLFACSSPEQHTGNANAASKERTIPNAPNVAQQSSLPTDPSIIDNSEYLSYAANPKDIKMYWKNGSAIISSFAELKKLEPKLAFAMNGGMYTQEYAPVGLYVEKGKQIRPIKHYNNPKVNFGIQPQGIFLIRENRAEVMPVENYKPESVIYATQSAPMLVIDSKINAKLPHSESVNIRNGVGMLPDGRVLLVLSRSLVTFQQFAQYFIDRGCISALYLDGGISEAYLPPFESYGSFGVLIGVVKK